MRFFRYYPSNPKNLDPELEKKIFYHSLLIPFLIVLIFWFVKIVEAFSGFSFVRFGVFPLHLDGLQGIIFSPFIHSDFSHLISNSLPFFILLFMLIYFYRRISYRIFFLLYFFSGVCVWLVGRPAWHIGASGVVYAMAAFHFVSGLIRSDVRLLTLSVVVVFLYGGLIWGLLPIRPEVSWEGHISGAISGIVLAIYYRKFLIRREKFDWEYEDDDDDQEVEDENELKIQDYQNQKLTETKTGEHKKPSGNISHTGEYLN